MRRLAIGFAGCEQKVGIVGELRGSGAQLEQRGVSLSRIPESGSQPALGEFVGGVFMNGCAEVNDRLRWPVQFDVIDSQKELDAASAGPRFGGGSQGPHRIFEFRLIVVNQPQVYICLGRTGLEAQNRLVFMCRLVEPSLLLVLLRGDEMRARGGIGLRSGNGGKEGVKEGKQGKPCESPARNTENGASFEHLSPQLYKPAIA